MSEHEYTPEQALQTLLRKIGERDESLAGRIRTAIDAGKDIDETETPVRRRQKTRTYRRKVPYSHEEALAVARDVLKAHFIELPLFINSAVADFESAALGGPESTPSAVTAHRKAIVIKGVREPKQIQIELQTETQLSNTVEDTMALEVVPAGLIQEERQNLLHLEGLTNF